MSETNNAQNLLAEDVNPGPRSPVSSGIPVTTRARGPPTIKAIENVTARSIEAVARLRAKNNRMLREEKKRERRKRNQKKREIALHREEFTAEKIAEFDKIERIASEELAEEELHRQKVEARRQQQQQRQAHMKQLERERLFLLQQQQQQQQQQHHYPPYPPPPAIEYLHRQFGSVLDQQQLFDKQHLQQQQQQLHQLQWENERLVAEEEEDLQHAIRASHHQPQPQRYSNNAIQAEKDLQRALRESQQHHQPQPQRYSNNATQAEKEEYVEYVSDSDSDPEFVGAKTSSELVDDSWKEAEKAGKILDLVSDEESTPSNDNAACTKNNRKCRKRCRAMTLRKGKKRSHMCQRRCVEGLLYCWQHKDYVGRGGQRRTRKRRRRRTKRTRRYRKKKRKRTRRHRKKTRGKRAS